MNRSNWPLLASVALAATALTGACTPNNNPPPGPPVLTEAFIIENGASATLITSTTAPCATTVTEGDGCDPSTDAICQDVPNQSWCRCQMNAAMPFHAPAPVDGSVDADVDGGAADGGSADDASADGPPPPPPGTWSCTFALNSGVLYIFDRLLDTAPLGDGNGRTPGVADFSSAPAPVNALIAGTDYGANGFPGSILFPLLGTLRADGPSLFVTGQGAGTMPTFWGPWNAALPANATVTFALSKTAVLAKDGVSSFMSSTPLVDGIVSYKTGAFGGSLTVPTPADPDAGTTVPPDMTPAVATFLSAVDTAQIAMHTKVTAMPAAGGAATPVVFAVIPVDGLAVNINAVEDPTATKLKVVSWPVDSVITVTIDATAASVAGDQLGAALTGSFTTSAM
jgi:hypothetical protein